MRYLGLAFVLIVLLASACVDQKENPTDPEQVAYQAPSQADGSSHVVLPRSAAPEEAEDSSPEANLIPGSPEAEYDPVGERIKVYTDFERFNGATGDLTEIEFQDLPWNGSSCPGPNGLQDSIPNPLTRAGVEFVDPWCLESQFCPDPTCPGSGVLLVIHTSATINYPQQTGGVMLAVEGIGDGPFVLRAEGRNGTQVTVTHHGIPHDTRFIGFTSSEGIARIQFLGAITHGNLPLRRVYFEGP